MVVHRGSLDPGLHGACEVVVGLEGLTVVVHRGSIEPG